MAMLAEATQFFDRAAATPEGQRVLRGHDEDYQFTLADGEQFFVEIRGGRLAVHPGETPRTGYFESTFIETGADTLRQLFRGSTRPTEAIQQRRFNMVIRMYEGLRSPSCCVSEGSWPAKRRCSGPGPVAEGRCG